MSVEGNRESLERIMAVCSETQSMIDIAAKQLYGLRQCRETGELIKKEIWESESKLIRLFGKLIVTKAKTKNQSQLGEYPKTEQWLDIVGIDPSLSKKLIKKLSLMKMLETTRDQLEKEMKKLGASDEEVRTLTTAVKNLKLWIDTQSQDSKTMYVNGNRSTADLHWSNFKSISMGTGGSSPYLGNSPKLQNSHHHHQQRPSTSSLPGGPTMGVGGEPIGMPPTGQRSPWVSNSQLDVNEQDRSQITTAAVQSLAGYADMQLPYATTRMTPPTTPLVPKTQKGGKFPTTPPPKRRNKLNLDSFKPLIKSTSHESQLSLKVAQDSKYSKKKPSNINIVGSSEAISNSSPMRKRSSGTLEDGTGTTVAASSVGSAAGRVSGQSSPLNSSPYRSPQLGKAIVDEVTGPEAGFRMNQLVVPPVSPGMNNSFNHKFQSKLVLSTCDHCRKQLIRGRVCKNCRLKFHNDCVSRAPSICEYYHSSIARDEDPTDLYYGPQQRHQHHPQPLNRRQQQQPQLQHFDSSSTASSCNSSSPSSPAHPISSASSHWASQQLNCNNAMHFTYPEPKTFTEGSSGIGSSLSSNSTPTVSVSAADAVNTSTSTDSDKSEKTITGSGDSSGDQNLNLDHLDSVDSSEDATSANLHRDNSISVALKEWDIPYEELKFHEIIGIGRFGTVHKGDWHGEVAIKVLNTDPSADNQAQQLHAFKLEVANLKKTRHENLVLFMGACMEPQRLAIVTSFVKGITLFNKLHVRKEKFLINQTIAIASQIAQGLGYLHAKGIVHKDLKTKNVFVENLKPSSSSSENFKVVISDFGLFSVSKLCHDSRKGRWLSIPLGWLWYLSPEIVRSLTPRSPFETDLPFTKESDIYAFGTVWHELLAGEWPFRSQPPESIIWMIGKGAIQPHLNAQAEFKEILMKCWAFRPEDRPNCQQVLKVLERLPRKRLARSPSHPIQLSRSAESIF